MRVTVFDRAAYSDTWGTNGACRPELFTRSVQISDSCPACGGPRGVPESRRFCQDEAYYTVDCWQNECGHIDYYPEVLEEAKRLLKK